MTSKPQATANRPRPKRSPLRACSDASVGRTGRALAGTAWVASDGSYAYATFGTASPLVAELAAIRNLIDAHPPDLELVLLTDCRPAVAMLEEFRRSRCMPVKAGMQSARAAVRLVRTIVLELDRRPVELRWIKGHAGHPLNEAADRLALQARRCGQGGGLLATLGGIADRIVAESAVAG